MIVTIWWRLLRIVWNRRNRVEFVFCSFCNAFYGICWIVLIRLHLVDSVVFSRINCPKNYGICILWASVSIWQEFVFCNDLQQIGWIVTNCKECMLFEDFALTYVCALLSKILIN